VVEQMAAHVGMSVYHLIERSRRLLG
jgi:hypothetical protein